MAKKMNWRADLQKIRNNREKADNAAKRRGKGKEAGTAAGGKSGEHGHPLRRAQYAADPRRRLEDFLAGKPPQDKEKHEEHEEQEEQRDDESFEE